MTLFPGTPGMFDRCQSFGHQNGGTGGNSGAAASSGAVIGETSRVQHQAQLVINGTLYLFFTNENSTGNGANSIIVKASVEKGGTAYPVSFSGNPTVTIAPGAWAYGTATVPGINQGDTIWTRTYASVGSLGQTWPYGNLCTHAANGEGVMTGDQTTGGAFTATDLLQCYSPYTIGVVAATTPWCILLGDSISVGQDVSNYGEQSFLSIALKAGHVPFLCVGKTGEKATDFRPLISSSPSTLRVAAMAGASYAIEEYGTNDVQNSETAVTMETNRQSLWAYLSGLGAQVWATTTTPRPTSTDSFATLVNQTPNTNDAARTALNDWVRGKPAPLSGYFETADTVESTRNSGKWIVGDTTGGVHPNLTGATVMAAAINPALLPTVRPVEGNTGAAVTFLNTSFGNGLTPGGYGFDRSVGSVSLDATGARRGGDSSASFASSASGAYVEKSIASDTVVVSFDFDFSGLPGAPGPIFELLSAQSSTQHTQISIKTTGKFAAIVHDAGTTQVTTSDSPLMLVPGTYSMSIKCVASGATWTMEFTIFAANDSIIYQSSQASIGSLSEQVWTLIRIGEVGGSMTWPSRVTNVRYTTDASAYPMRPSKGDDTHTLQAVSAGTWVDTPSLIQGGILFGQNAQFGVGTNLQDLVRAEGSTKANRRVWISHAMYTNMPANLGSEAMMLDGSALGHPCVPIIAPLGHDNQTTGWPAGGLADFSNGAVDSTLTVLCNLLNTLPATPVLIRLWREMNLGGVIYGTNGAANGGVNETPTSYITAWRYVIPYIRARCPYARFAWCPSVHGGAALTELTQFYPGDAYVDWNGIDWYIGAAGGFANLTNAYGGFNSKTGTISRKPFMVCETQVDISDPTRPTEIAGYTSFFAGRPGVNAVVFWDSTQGGEYEIADTTVGFVSAYQAVVNNAPFLGTPNIATSEPVINNGVNLAVQPSSNPMGGSLPGYVNDGRDTVAA